MPIRALFDAEISLWIPIPLKRPPMLPAKQPWGRYVIFGYCEHHPRLGGKSWMSTSPVEQLLEYESDGIYDDRADEMWSAITASGRRYMLGNRITLDQLPIHGKEALVAFRLLLEGDADCPMPDVALAADRQHDIEWLTCGKMARHLGLMEPDRRDREGIIEFLREHGDEYQARLRRELGHPFL